MARSVDDIEWKTNEELIKMWQERKRKFMDGDEKEAAFFSGFSREQSIRWYDEMISAIKEDRPHKFNFND